MSALYHISRAGQEIGRYTLADLEKAIRLGKVHATDYCWVDGMAGWEAVSAILPSSAGPSQPPPAPSAPPSRSSAPANQFVGPNEAICSRCGVRGVMSRFQDSTLIPRGSASYWIAIILCFPISILYYLHIEQKHRHSTSCGGCGADALVPLSTPLGRDLLSKSRNRT